MPYAKMKDGTSIYYKDWGTGRPIVFIHGWPLDADMWDYQMEPLARGGYRCIAYDRRGFGRSGQPFAGYDYDTFADDLATLLETLDADNVCLTGFSMGGGEVARYMSRHEGARVATVALIAAVTPYLIKARDNPEGVDKSVFDEMRKSLTADRAAFLASFGKTFFGAGLLNFTVSNDILQWAQGLALQASALATRNCIAAFSETDFRKDLRSINVPTLIVHGDADKTVPVEVSARKTAGMIDGALYKEYAGAPHGLFFTHKEQLNADLAEFVAQRDSVKVDATPHRRPG